MNKRNRGHINDNWISKDKKSKEELCELRHEIGRAGRACCNCVYSDRCNEREDRGYYVYRCIKVSRRD